jgi:hypothetical protein
MGSREGGLTIAGELEADANILKGMPKAIWMVERFGKSHPGCDTLACLVVITGLLLPDRATHVGAYPRVVTAERLAKMTMTGHVVGLDANTAIVHGPRDITSK